ncbi:MAG: hypothetical protein V1494_06015 [Candidatus Diapherotrites archaeon]
MNLPNTSFNGNLIAGSSTRSFILSCISVDKGASVNEIHSFLKENGERQLSYQALHKIVNQMLGEGILLKSDDKKIFLNREWAKKMEVFSKNLAGSLFMDFARNKTLSRKIHMTVTFEKDKEMADFIRNQLIAAYGGERK